MLILSKIFIIDFIRLEYLFLINRNYQIKKRVAIEFFIYLGGSKPPSLTELTKHGISENDEVYLLIPEKIKEKALKNIEGFKFKI